MNYSDKLAIMACILALRKENDVISNWAERSVADAEEILKLVK